MCKALWDPSHRPGRRSLIPPSAHRCRCSQLRVKDRIKQAFPTGSCQAGAKGMNATTPARPQKTGEVGTGPLREAKGMRTCQGSWAQQAATQPRAGHLQPLEQRLWQGPLPDPSLPGPDRLDHLDLLALDFHGLLPEVHADGGLSLVREGPPAEAEGQAGLAHVGVPNHDDFEDANLHVLVQRRVQLQGRQASGRGGLQVPMAQDGLRHLPRTGPGPQPPSRAPHKENGHVSALEASELCACVYMCVCACVSVSARVCVRQQRVRARA